MVDFLQNRSAGGFQRVSAGLYQGPDGKLVRSAQNPVQQRNDKASAAPGPLQRQPGTVPNGMMDGMAAGVGAGLGGSSNVPGSRSDGFLKGNFQRPGGYGNAIGGISQVMRPLSPNYDFGQPPSGHQAIDGGQSPNTFNSFMSGVAQGVGPGIQDPKMMPGMGNKPQAMGGPGPQTGGPLVSALNGMNQPQAQDPQAAFRKYQIQRGQMQQQPGGPQNYSLTRMMPDGRMVY